MATSSATVRSLNSGNRAAWVSEELEAARVWSDALDGFGDPRPAPDWSWLSATHGC